MAKDATGKQNTRRRIAVCAVVLLVGCGGPAHSPSGQDSVASEGSNPRVTDAVAPSPGPSSAQLVASTLTFQQDDRLATHGTLTPETGGTLEVTAADGTRFRLDVPPGAVWEETEASVTPLIDVHGVGDGPVHAVRLEPEGITLFEEARLLVLPATPIAVAEQLIFHARGDGSNAVAALVDPEASDVVILLQHFSIAGTAKAAAAASWNIGQSHSAVERLSNEVGKYVQEQRKRAARGDDGPSEVSEVLERLLRDAERDVIAPLREAALLTCEGATELMKMLRAVERQRALVGISTEATFGAMLAEVNRIWTSSFAICEREAVVKCQVHPDPGLLVEFWITWDRSRSLAGQTHMSPDGDLAKLARDKCGWSYSFNRTLEMAQGQMSVRYEWTGIVRVADEGVISGTGTGFLRGSQGTCTYGDPPTEVPIDVTSSATFTFEFQGARAGDTLTIEHPATTADVVVEGSFAPCMEAGPLAEFVIETALRDPALLPPAVVADRVGRTTERRNGATSVTTLSPPPTPRPTPSPSSQPTIAGPSTP